MESNRQKMIQMIVKDVQQTCKDATAPIVQFIHFGNPIFTGIKKVAFLIHPNQEVLNKYIQIKVGKIKKRTNLITKLIATLQYPKIKIIKNINFI